ncbi:MAG: amino acid adenylation domain-containing protein [Bryobacteraceae bacterium]|nr:amino acid adenylation domain-containing protein [Bryobacteraceae bacterium]
MQDSPNPLDAIAVIGMAGRFPGADSVDQFWRNLREGRETISRFQTSELEVPGLDLAQAARDPRYVRAKGILNGVQEFDAAFFGLLPREAELMDPQQRVFLELCWQAMDDGGYSGESPTGAVGVFAGAYMDTYLLHNLCSDQEFRRRLVESIQVGSLQTELGNDKDYLATRVSFKLGLKGPSMTIQTACSTSLVAIATACQSLLTFQCDMALAGGVTITLPQKKGYHYEEEGMLSPDGHCRPFDAAAQGTVFSNGAGVVLLKRLHDALADRDSIYAVIRGFAVNNDGSDKMSYTAPSVDGQASVIAAAHALAGVSPETVTYVEAHGTATPLGDPIEVAGLSRAFRLGTDRRQFCALGSVKSNIGHLDVASGVAALIKTALCLKHGVLVPTLNYRSPNPKIDFSNSPFYVNTELRPWVTEGFPRRAGISSFGVGGTNAHLVLEAPPEPPPPAVPASYEVLLLSARTETALNAVARELADHLESQETINLRDVAFTLDRGRKHLAGRRTVVAPDRLAAAGLLRQPGGCTKRLPSANVAFLFPGQGSQHVNMARGLYDHEPVFRSAIATCADLFREPLGVDLISSLFPAQPSAEGNAAITRTVLAQPAIFAVEYALAQLWISLGVRPERMIGHSVGEFVAACLSGVFSLEDAIAIIAARGRLMENLPGGGMLSVRLPLQKVESLLTPEIQLAASNGPSLCVLAGAGPEIDRLAAKLNQEGVAVKRLHTSHAFHSTMMDPVVAPFANFLRGIALNAPRIPILSCVTRAWLTEEDARSPEYWARHLRQPVYFHEAVQGLCEDKTLILLEVGPGQTLSTLARQAEPKSGRVILSSLDHPDRGGNDHHSFLAATGQLWAAGVEVDFDKVRRGGGRRVPLPPYPFERKRFWVEAKSDLVESRAGQDALESSHRVEEADMRPSELKTSRKSTLLKKLQESLSELSGISLEDLDPAASFLELGFDSLLLTQVSREIERAFQVKITMRQLLEGLPTIEAIAARLDELLPAERFAVDAKASAVAPPADPPAPVFEPLVPSAKPAAGAVETLIARQLDLMQQQLQVLRSTTGQITFGTDGAEIPSGLASISQPDPAAPKPDLTAFGGFRPADRSATELTPRQQQHLEELIACYTKRTVGSKRLTEQHRHRHADPRTVSGFNRLWKEMVYPLWVDRSRGSRLWDVDGNEYIDLLNGFGLNFLGHSPAFVTEALQAQLQRGIEIGPMTPLAGEVAQMLCEMTGMDRASFVNTGSEAVQAAMRLARAVTGRDKVVVFAKDYHGNFDEVLVRGTRAQGQPRSFPIAPGIPRRAVEDVIVLEYGSPEALEVIRARAPEIAAVLVEPIQSRRPEFQPREFITELRTLTSQTGILLVFDEVITGFRTGLKGAQEFYGVRADLATYGKVIGGGMPIGAVAGRAEFMDTFDGGLWQYGDDSFPDKGVTFFAGTFIRHPLAMAGAHATLTFLRKQPSEFWSGIRARADRLAGSINAILAGHELPLRMPNFGSQMFVRVQEDAKLANLLFFHLRLRGVYLQEGFPCYLTAAHTDADVDAVIDAFRDGAAEMQEGGWLPDRHPVARAERNTPMVLAAAEEQVAPVTSAQREIWLAAQMGDDANCAYNEATTLRLSGPLDKDALRQALQEVVRRHDALRATFTSDGVSMVIADRLAINVESVDFSGLAPEARDQELAAMVVREGETPFDLTAGPLLRASLAQLDPEEHVLFLTAHHIVCDGWSFNVLLEELSQLYARFSRATDSEMEDAPSYAAYARQEVARRSSPRFAEIEGYWLSQYAAVPAALELPADHPRPPNRTYRGSTERRTIGEAVYRSVKKLGASQGATLFATLLAGFEALLFRLAGQQEFPVGIPAAGQSVEGAAGLIGHCVNFLPLRARTAGNMSFREHLADTRRRLLEAQENQPYTYGELIPKLPLTRIPGRMPLVEVEFNVERVDYHQEFAGLRSAFEPSPKRYVNFDIFLNVIETRSGLILDCDYNSEVFDATTIQRWLRHYEHLLDAAARSPELPLERLPLLDETERTRIVRGFNETHRAFPRELRAHQLFELRAAEAPHATAVTFEGRDYSYRDLNREANRLAGRISEMGAVPGGLVALLLEPSFEMAASMLAVWKAGCAYVPLDPSHPVERNRMAFEDARPLVVLTQSHLLSLVPESPATVLAVDQGRPAPSSDDRNPAHPRSPSELAYVIFTSGSTGRSKGVAVEHHSLTNFLLSMQERPGFEAGQSLLAVTTISFDIAVLEWFLPLISGGRVIPASPRMLADGMQLFEFVANSAPDVMQATPTLWRMLIEAGWQGDRRLKVLCGGEPLSSALAAQLAGSCRELWNMYGPTETTIWSACGRLDKDEEVSVGRPIANTRVYVLDPAGAPCPVGVPGEIFIAGAGVARGYLGNPSLTAEKFVPDPFEPGARMYRTGDLGRFTPDGSLLCLGRLDSQVKIRGFRVELEEIETALLQLPGVSAAAAAVREDHPGDRRLVAYLVPSGRNVLDPAAVRSALAGRLPGYMVPAHLMILERLPLTQNGKLDRKRLPPLADSAAPAARPARTPRNELETRLVEIWREVLRVPGIGIDDDIFEAGGDSLLVFQIAMRASKSGIPLQPRSMFLHRTIARLAGALQEDSVTTGAAGRPLSPARSKYRIELT